MTQELITTTHGNASARMPRFGKGRLEIRQSSPITDEQLRARLPSIFAERKHSGRSEKFAYVPTTDALARLRSAGFSPFAAMQGGSRDTDKLGFTKHFIRFRHESQGSILEGEVIPEVVLLNAHDGTSAFRLMLGIFRGICSNGMISAQDLVDLRIPHRGQALDAVAFGADALIAQTPAIGEKITTWDGLMLSDAERGEFARRALALRFGAKKKAPIAASDLLVARRLEDQRMSLWTTLNVIQENVLKGGASYVHVDANNKPSFRHVRPIGGISDIVKLNRGVWQIAEEFAGLVA